MSKSPPKCATGCCMVGDPNLIQSFQDFWRPHVTLHNCNEFPYYCSTIPARAESSSMGCQLYVCFEKYSRAASMTNKVSNSSAERRAPHQIPPPHSSTASPPFPHRLEISIPIDHRPESSRMAENSRRTQVEQPNHSQRMSLVARQSRNDY
jgi:hypothetical protein